MSSRNTIIFAVAVLLASCSPAAVPTLGPAPAQTGAHQQAPSGGSLASQPTAGATSPGATNPQPTASTSPGASSVSNIDPLTGQAVSDVSLLNRRPLVIKVENLPRGRRPQWGLTQADLVYEYYTEQGTSRFAAVFYGKDAQRVGPIRSGRFFDANVVDMYKGILAFGSAYSDVLNSFKKSDFADRLVVEENSNCPPMCRYEPQGQNDLVTNTSQLSAYITQKGVSNSRQDLSGMTFSAAAPADGQPANQVTARFSGAIYNRWDYDPASQTYLRWVDTQDDPDNQHEVYARLTDRANGQQISADNLVVIFVPYSYYARTAETEVFQVSLMGTGRAYVARDGQIYPVEWKRLAAEDVLTLVGKDGKSFALKPGNTWFEVLHAESKMTQKADSWRFTFVLPK
jgi:hypothetical protein